MHIVVAVKASASPFNRKLTQLLACLSIYYRVYYNIMLFWAAPLNPFLLLMSVISFLFLQCDSPAASKCNRVFTGRWHTGSLWKVGTLIHASYQTGHETLSSSIYITHFLHLIIWILLNHYFLLSFLSVAMTMCTITTATRTKKRTFRYRDQGYFHYLSIYKYIL